MSSAMVVSYDMRRFRFFEDEATKMYPERLKAAAALWKIVRESDMKKEYSHDLLEKYTWRR